MEKKNIMNMLLHIEMSSSDILVPCSFYWNTFFLQGKEEEEEEEWQCSRKLVRSFGFTKFSYRRSFNARNSRILDFRNFQIPKLTGYRLFEFLNSPTSKLPNFSNVLFSNCETFEFVHTQISKFPIFPIFPYSVIQLLRVIVNQTT